MAQKRLMKLGESMDLFSCALCAFLWLIFLWPWPLLVCFVAFGGEWRWGHKLREDDDENIGIRNIVYVGFFGTGG